jgi:hypothetical protein
MFCSYETRSPTKYLECPPFSSTLSHLNSVQFRPRLQTWILQDPFQYYPLVYVYGSKVGPIPWEFPSKFVTHFHFPTHGICLAHRIIDVTALTRRKNTNYGAPHCVIFTSPCHSYVPPSLLTTFQVPSVCDHVSYSYKTWDATVLNSFTLWVSRF